MTSEDGGDHPPDSGRSQHSSPRTSRRFARTMGRAAVLVGTGILISRLLGFVRNSVLLGVLGLSSEADLYNAAFVIPDYLFFLMAGGYLTITFLPILSRHIAAGDEEGEWRSFVAVFRPVALVMIGLTVLAMIWARPLVEFLYRSFDPSDLDRLTGLVRIVLPAQVFFVLGSLFMAVQYARQRFLVPTLAPIVYNLAIIAGGAVTWAMGNPSPEGFAWGALVGAIVGNFALQWWGASRIGLRWPRHVPWRHPVLGEYLLLALPLMLGQSVAALDEQFIRVFGQLAGVGGITALVAGRQLSMVPVGVVAQAAGVAAYPFLVRLAAEGREDELEAEVGSAVRATITAAMLAAAGGVRARPAGGADRIPTRLFWSRGHAHHGGGGVCVRPQHPRLGGPAGPGPRLLRQEEDVDPGAHRDRRCHHRRSGLLLARRAVRLGGDRSHQHRFDRPLRHPAGGWLVHRHRAGPAPPRLGCTGEGSARGVLAGGAGLGIVALFTSGEVVPSAGQSFLALVLGGLVVVAVFAGCLLALRSPELATLLRRQPPPDSG